MTTLLRRAFLGLVFGASIAAALAAPAKAQSGYDGVWSVLIITEKGTCDRGYRYPIRISHGRVGHLNPNSSFNINGRVGAGGTIFVKISRGEQSASGSGRMVGGSSGSGRWKTASGECSGVWTAERRS
ncbi:MAG TPA: hypothetical protein VHA70_08570 [Bauldia sp.]|nr:hypothetical protein [Bauldia sp.]